MSNILSKEIQCAVSVNEVDFLNRITPAAILRYFQDIATVHAEEIGVGFTKLKDNDRKWIISRTSFEIKRPLTGEELIKIVTFPGKPRRVDANRKYYIYDKDNKLAITGISKWCVVGISDKGIKRCDELFNFSEDSYNQDPVFEGSLCKITGIDDYRDDECRLSSNVLITDLDRNCHMNNAKYADAIYNACGFEKLSNFNIRKMHVNYLSELLINDIYKVYRKDVSELESLFEIVKITEGEVNTVVFRAVIEWLKI